MLRSLSMPVASAREAIVQSLVGSTIWVIAVAVVQPGWAPALLMLGPLVLFPMLLDMWGETGTPLRRLSTLAFLPVIASYACTQDVLAAALVLPWLAFTLLFAVHRFKTMVRDGQYMNLLIRCYLVVGASWLVMARLGHRPLGFEHVIVHATAVHFHYAGFVLPIVASLLVRANPSRHGSLMLMGLLAGMPLVALGITLAQFNIHWVETAAACAFSATSVWFAIEQLRFGLTARRPLLVMSSVALIAAMSLASLYALRHYWTIEGISIDFMIRSHGPIQVFGFALPGVMSWALDVDRRET